MKRLSLLVVVTAVVFSACSGARTIPQPVVSSAFAALPLAQTCNVKGFWYLRGSCKKTNLTSKGGTFRLAPYRSITFVLTLGANTVAGKDPFFFSDATGNGDVTGKNAGQAFKPYSKSACFTGFSCPGTPVIYFSNINTGNEVGLIGASAAKMYDAGALPGRKLCVPAVATKNGWIADVTIGVKPSKHRFTINYPADKLFLPTGQLVVAYACE